MHLINERSNNMAIRAVVMAVVNTHNPRIPSQRNVVILDAKGRIRHIDYRGSREFQQLDVIAVEESNGPVSKRNFFHLKIWGKK